ncbi:MAG: cyclopropane-fatty-acyl-phospholipid synthase [Gaiellales bacterium]|nr:cyclopropane-fatty-acyl-phospholipid synthase [Gaiellales bacterium]
MSRVERGSAAVARTAPGPVGAIARRVLCSALAGLQDGALELRAPDGTRRFGDPDAEPQVLDVHDPRFFARLARSGKLAVGEGYQAGEWSTPDLPGLVALLARNHDQVFGRPPLSVLAAVTRAIPRVELPRGLRRAERDVHAHYDLGNAFFSLWLDESMTYSCGLYETAETTLAEAQQAKYRALADATRIGPADHVLEIGTGWGGLALHLARERGCRVTTATISREQHALATARVAAAGLAGRIDVVYSDYRQLEGSYSRILSVEMIEAIGHRQLGTYFATIDRLLAPDGLAGIQAILVPDQRYKLYRSQRDWIRKHIFPGGMLPSLEAVTTAARRSSGLMVHEVREIGPHYARTLRDWRERFLLRRPEVEALGLDLHFQRTWEYYLAFCEAAFATHALRDAQLVLTRPLNRTLALPV